MKYIVIGGWKPYDEWNEYAIGVYDNWDEAIGKAYNYLQDMINSYGSGPLRNNVITIDQGKKSSVFAKFKDSDDYVYINQLVSISPILDIHDEAGYWMEIVETKHAEHNWDGQKEGALDDLLSDYVKILTYNDSKKEEE